MSIKKLENIVKKGNRFTIPSGIRCNAEPVVKKYAHESEELGVIVSKGTTLEPRTGHQGTILTPYLKKRENNFEYDKYQGFLNAVGLKNPGIKTMCYDFIPNLNVPENKYYVLQLAGKDKEEFVEMAKVLANSPSQDMVDGIEINCFCPNVTDPEKFLNKMYEVGDIVKQVKAITGKDIFVKLGPRIKGIENFAEHMIKCCASGISGINTDGPTGYKVEGYDVLDNKVGGHSGKGIYKLGKDVFERVISHLAKKFPKQNIPYIAYGGINNAEQIREYKKIYHRHFKKGVITFGLGTEAVKQMPTNLMLKKYLPTLAKDLVNGTNKAVKYLNKNIPQIKKVIYDENHRIDKELNFLEFDSSLDPAPGQFIFLSIPEFDRVKKPFAVLGNNPISLLIKKRGSFTKKLRGLESEQYLPLKEKIFVEGPYGNPIFVNDTKKPIVFVGGGCGAASLYSIADHNPENPKYAFIGGRNHKQAEFFEKLFEPLYKTKTKVSSDEQGWEFQGNVVDLLKRNIKALDKESLVFNCGPDIMVGAAIKAEMEHFKSENIFSAPEYITRCGVGLCGECYTPTGYLSCVDGPFVNLDQIGTIFDGKKAISFK